MIHPHSVTVYGRYVLHAVTQVLPKHRTASTPVWRKKGRKLIMWPYVVMWQSGTGGQQAASQAQPLGMGLSKHGWRSLWTYRRPPQNGAVW